LAYGKEAKNFYIDPIFEGEPLFTGMEVYVEKDGKFFALYQTMDYSDYRYSTHLEKGTYTFQCRVMYNTKAQYKVDIDKKKIEIKEPLKTLGVHDVLVRVHPEITSTIKVNVVAE